ncbi:MAG: response regulator transcription factor [Burkholderiales bacterium]|nr:response regulator transcription factor [Burkholderiales bacterium]
MAGPDAAAPLRLLLVDDEAPARLRLRSLVEEVAEPTARVVAEADSAVAAQAVLAGLAGHPGPAGQVRAGEPGGGGEGGEDAGAGAGGRIDAVLLDIGLPGPSGLALAATLRGLPRPPAVVFVTAHAGHALQAFDLQALDYLTKPVRRERLQQALARVAQWVGAQRAQAAAAAPAFGMAGAPGRTAGAAPVRPVLLLHERGRVLRLPHDEILSLRAEHKAVFVRTARQQLVVDESLNELEQRLGPGFLRVHRNALVALTAIRALELRPGLDEEGGDGWAVRIGGAGAADEWLAVSRRQVASVKAALAQAAPGGG